ncbi:MAG: hypothetical protein ACREUG_11310 [Steroidobacteraceae bacterium]
MQYEQDPVPRASEIHRFFPEWADRPASAGPLLEGDHNSYLAGGYSEEFGYRVRPDFPPIFPLLAGDPDGSWEWTVQIDGLHPGYPECPRPTDRSGTPPTGDGVSPDGVTRAFSPRSAVTTRHAGITRVVWVARSGAERRVRLLGAPIVALWARLRIRSHVRDRGL